jgi:hypothetical protein
MDQGRRGDSTDSNWERQVEERDTAAPEVLTPGAEGGRSGERADASRKSWIWWRDLPDLASARMRFFEERGLSKGAGASHPPAKDGHGSFFLSSPLIEEARSVRLDNGRTIWVQLGGRHSYSRKHRVIKVFDQASITDSAIISALMVTEASALRTSLGDKDISKRAQITIQYIERLDEELAHRGLAKAGLLSAEEMEAASDIAVKLLQDPELDGVTAHDDAPEVQAAFEFVRDLLRYYRPDFDDIPRDEQIALIGHQCSRIHSALKAIKSVVEFAEFGTPEGRSNPATKNAHRDISAAHLYDIERRTYEEIAVFLGESSRSPSSEDKHDYPTTRQRVKRGRELLRASRPTSCHLIRRH